MQEAVVLAVTFERPANFDLAAYWKGATAQLQQKREQIRATVALAPDAVAEIHRWYRLSEVNEVKVALELPQSWRVFQIWFESKREARFIALGLGSRAVVVGPVELRDEVRAEMVACAAGRVVGG